LELKCALCQQLIPLDKVDRHNCRPSKPEDITLSEKKHHHHKTKHPKNEQKDSRPPPITRSISILAIPLKKPVAKKPTHSGSSSDDIQPSPKGVPFDQTSSSVSSDDENELEKSSKTGLVDKFEPPRIKKSALESSSETDSESDHNGFNNVVHPKGRGPATIKLGESIKALTWLRPQPSVSPHKAIPIVKESQSQHPYPTNANSPKEAVHKSTPETRQ